MSAAAQPSETTNRGLLRSLREAPATVPGLAAIVLFVIWASDQAGYPLTHWGPGGLIVLGLLGIALVAVRLDLAEMPVTVRVALASLGAYTALSYLSILWAGVPGDAWEGANRTFLYLLVFALFACWRQRGATAALLLVAWILAMVALAIFTLLHLDGAGAAGLQSMIPAGRLEYPSGYANANAAQWLMAFWPALLLARSERLHWALRGLLAGGAVLLAGVALLSQSRGSLYATPVLLVLVFALLPGRVRTFALLLPVAAGIAVAAPAVLRVGDHLRAGSVTHANVHGATVATLLAALAVSVLVAGAAALEPRWLTPPATRRLVHRSVGALAIAVLLAGLAGGLAVAGNPVARAEHAWSSFKSGYGYGPGSHESRLVSGFGSSRYDFYRVALDEFRAHPLVGIGADNFREQYLAHARSEETPHYPHSIEMRTLVETGLLGVLLALLGLGGALLAGARALRSGDPLAGPVAAAAFAGFAYWVVHGSFDWFWEFAGLGAPAFALLGLICALAPARHTPARLAAGKARPLARGALLRRPAIAAGVLVALAGALSLTLPWLSQLEVESAARTWTTAPRSAYSKLEEASSLNPLSNEAYLLAGSIALRYREFAHAEREFVLANGRDRGDAYATLERGAIASSKGQRRAAQMLLERAVRLDPHEELAREALRTVRLGRRVDVEQLNRSILLKAQQLA